MGANYSKLKSLGRNDPPVCDVFIDGRLCGIEVTELVDANTIKVAENGSCYPHKTWEKHEFFTKLEALIARKDKINEEKRRIFEL